MTKKSIYLYTDPGQFLKDRWEMKKETNPQFSLRAWARALEISSPSSLIQMISSKRLIPKQYLPGFCKSLDLNDDEARYLEGMIDLSRCKTEVDYEFQRKKMIQMRPHDTTEKEVIILDRFDALADPLTTFILEICMLKKIEFKPALIRSMIRINYTTFEIKQSIMRLLSLGLLKLEDQYLVRGYDHLFSKQDEVDPYLRQYHGNLSTIAKKAVTEMDVKEKEFNAVAMNVSLNEIPNIKEYLRKCLNEYISKYESQKYSGDVTCQLNINWFIVGERL